LFAEPQKTGTALWNPGTCGWVAKLEECWWIGFDGKIYG